MKKILSAIVSFSLAAFLALGAFALAGENYALFSETSDVDIPLNEHVAGDANGDGIVNLLDVIATLRYMVGSYSNTSRDGVDVNCDGTVGPIDALLVIRHIVGDEVGLGTVVNADGSAKDALLAEESTETAFEITVVSFDSDIDGVFLGWFTSESAAKALNTKFAAADEYSGTVYGAVIPADMAFVGVDMFTSAPYGIRFISKIDKAVIAAIEKVNAANRTGKNGTFTPSNEWENGIGFGTALAIDVAVDGIPEKADGGVVSGGMSVPAVYTYTEDDTALFFTATVLGVDTPAMADKIAARPYITYVDANGNEHTVYADGENESFYNVVCAVADSDTATEDEKAAASTLLGAYSGDAIVTKSTIAQFNLSSADGSADNDNAYVELDRTTLVALNGESGKEKDYRYKDAFYPRITKVRDDLYLMTFNYRQAGQHIYWTTSKDGVNWETPYILYASDKNKFTYQSGSLAGKADMYFAATADHCVLEDGTVMCVYSRRPRKGYSLNEYTPLNTIEVIRGVVKDGTIEWSTPVSVYHGQNWEPEILQRKNGDIEIYWSHSAPMLYLYGYDEEMRSSGIAMISSSDKGKTWTPNVTADDSNNYAGKRIYQFAAGEFTYDNGTVVNFYHGQMPGVAELVDGRMMVVGETRPITRSYHKISMARSNADGTWTELGIDEAGPADAVEEMFDGAGPTLMRFDSGELLLTYNDDGVMYVRTLDKTASNASTAYASNAFDSAEGTDSGFWSSSAPVDSHTAILAMCYKKYNGLAYETVTNEDGTTSQTLHNTTVIGKVRLNHTVDAVKKNVVADGNLWEWKNITDALFVGSTCDVQATYRFAYDDDYIYVAIDRTDSLNNKDDTNYVMVATADGYVKAEISYGDYTLPSGVTGGNKNAVGGRVYELCFDRAALGLGGDYIRVCPGFTDVATGACDRIDGTDVTDTSSWIKINLK